MLPIRFKPLCLIILLLLAAGLTGCAAAATPAPMADGPNVAPTAAVGVAEPAITPQPTAALTPIPTNPPFTIPTPYPTVCYTQEDASRELQVCDLPEHLIKPTPAYPALDYKLEHLVLAVEKGWPTGGDGILHGEYKEVEIDLWGNLDYVVQWLEVNDAAIYTVKPNYISAAVPVRLLGELSRQRGINRVEKPEYSIDPCMDCEPREPSLGAMRVGQAKKFFVFSAFDYPPGTRITVNYPGDTADLSLGSCASSQKISPPLHNGEYLTIAACAPGDALVSLLFYDDAPDKGVWRAYRQWQISVVNPPPVAVSPDLSVIKVGQSRTYTLNTTFEHPAGIRVLINDEDYSPKGNVSFGDCPGKKGDSRVLNDGDTLTITGCSVGVGDVNFYRDNILVLDDGMRVWTD